MARYTGPKNKLARKIGEDLGLKTNALKVARRLMVKPGQHGHRNRRRTSDYGTQLSEKQKIKYIYGITENKLQRAYKKASRNPTATGSAMLSLLEKRLDNVIYRAGFAPTRAAARQYVNHGHVLVDNKKLNIPSYEVKVGEVISLTKQGQKIPVVAELLEDSKAATVEWLERQGPAVKVKRLPERDDIKEKIAEQLVVEFYSR